MDEMHSILPTGLDSALNEFYTARRPDPVFAERLETQLRQRQIERIAPGQKARFSFSDTRRSFMHTLRARPILALFVAILALIVLTGMVYALGRLTGFIPGFGFTANTGIVYVLSEPVEISQGGMTLRLDKAVSDDTRFWVALHVKGLNGQETTTQAFVLLPDGKKIQLTIAKVSSNPVDGGTSLSYLFPPIAGQPQIVRA